MSTTTTTYTVTSKPGMTPFASPESIGQAIAAAISARSQGLDGKIIDADGNQPEATAADVREAEAIVGCDLDAASMDRPVPASYVVDDAA